MAAVGRRRGDVLDHRDALRRRPAASWRPAAVASSTAPARRRAANRTSSPAAGRSAHVRDLADEPLARRSASAARSTSATSGDGRGPAVSAVPSRSCCHPGAAARRRSSAAHVGGRLDLVEALEQVGARREPSTQSTLSAQVRGRSWRKRAPQGGSSARSAPLEHARSCARERSLVSRRRRHVAAARRITIWSSSIVTSTGRWPAQCSA